MRTIVALKPCPQGQQPGDTFTVPDLHATALVMVGAARYVTAMDRPAETAGAEDAEDESVADPPARSRRRYARRDLTAEA